MPDLYSLPQWIEDHQATVDLLKWLALLVIAWAAGLFRYLRDLTRTPRLAVSEVVSRCLIVETGVPGTVYLTPAFDRKTREENCLRRPQAPTPHCGPRPRSGRSMGRALVGVGRLSEDRSAESRSTPGGGVRSCFFPLGIKSLTYASKASARHGRCANSQRHQRRAPL